MTRGQVQYIRRGSEPKSKLLSEQTRGRQRQQSGGRKWVRNTIRQEGVRQNIERLWKGWWQTISHWVQNKGLYRQQNRWEQSPASRSGRCWAGQQHETLQEQGNLNGSCYTAQEEDRLRFPEDEYVLVKNVDTNRRTKATSNGYIFPMRNSPVGCRKRLNFLTCRIGTWHHREWEVKPNITGG